MNHPATDFASTVVRWQQSHGRHSLPWQHSREPYGVWLSEIMLQQTQVSTVLAYYPRFVAQFPNVQALAQASQEQVLALWSGLGYYSRARNLHRCAQQVAAQHGGQFPRSAEQLSQLPGIGRSTATAIAAFCFGERAAILDGNVKRVLTRYLAFEADLSVAANERALWATAQDLLPQRNLAQAMPRYTQGLMDLGATVCTRSKPNCAQCPLQSQCQAHQQGRPQDFPVKTRKLKRSAEALWLLWGHTRQGAVWLLRRPQHGVWAGLHCLPSFATEQALQGALPPAHRAKLEFLPVVNHTLTHKDLFLHPCRVLLPPSATPAVDGAWYPASKWPTLGLPAPVRTLLVNG